MSGYFAFPLQGMLWAQFRQAGTLWGTPVCEPVRGTCEPLGGGGGAGYGILWLQIMRSQTSLGKSLFWFAAQLAEGRAVALFSLLAALCPPDGSQGQLCTLFPTALQMQPFLFTLMD